MNCPLKIPTCWDLKTLKVMARVDKTFFCGAKNAHFGKNCLTEDLVKIVTLFFGEAGGSVDVSEFGVDVDG